MKVIIKKYPKLPQAREIIGKTQEPSYYFEKMQGLDPAYVKTVEQIFRNVWQEKKGATMKANKDALTLSADFLTLFIVEAINRAAQVAKTEDSTTIEFSHLEKILPQLLLDF